MAAEKHPDTAQEHAIPGLCAAPPRLFRDREGAIEYLGSVTIEASARGWRVAHLPGAHLHQIIDPAGTARHLVECATTT